MIENKERIGNFTSSEIWALMTLNKPRNDFGVPAITYIAEKRMERLLGRSISEEISARPLIWGKVLERHVFELLGLSYTLTSEETKVHPEINYWSGSKDGTHEGQERAVIDIKCPITLKSFCALVMPLYCGLDGNEAMNAIRFGFTHDGVTYEKHKDGEKYYQQLVSNACIEGVDWAELIVYAPYLSELNKVRELCDGNPKAYGIWSAQDNELPYLIDGGYFKNLNIIRFSVPEEDKALLTKNVIKAGQLLGVEPGIITAEYDHDVKATIVRNDSL